LIVLATIAGVFLAMFITATMVCVIYELRSMKSPGSRLRWLFGSLGCYRVTSFQVTMNGNSVPARR
jgi:hypothetical protein